MKNTIKNEKGIALVVTLMLLVLGFAIVAILFRLSTQETKLTRLEQGYSTALDAAKSATDLFITMVQNQQSTPPTSSPASLFGTNSTNSNCLKVKMYNATGTTTSGWSTVAAWSTYGCPSQAHATSSDPTDNPDITITLSNYKVYLKLIDTVSTDATDAVPCYAGCYYYTVVARSQASSGTGPQANITFVYRYFK